MKVNKASVFGGLLALAGFAISAMGDHFTEKGNRDEMYEDLEKRYGLKPVENETDDDEEED